MSSNSAGPDFTTLHPPGTAPKITSIFDFSTEALGELKLWIEQAGLAITISQIVGFQQFAAQVATSILTSETTTSTSYTDLATPGPQLTTLPDGRYVLLFGAFASNSGTGVSVFSPTINNAAAVDADQGGMSGTQGLYSTRATTATLASGTNTVKLQYKVNSGTGTFLNRWLIALRYANP